MKNLFLLAVFFFISILGYAQSAEKDKLSIDFQISDLRSIYAYQSPDGYPDVHFPFNFSSMMEINYRVAKSFSIGGHLRYASTMIKEPISNDSDSSGPFVTTSSPLLIIAPNIEYNFPSLITRNFLGIDDIEPYLAVEIGYAFLLNDKDYFDAVRPNGWIYTVGAGTKLNMNDNFYFKLEANFNERLLGRFGLGWRI